MMKFEADIESMKRSAVNRMIRYRVEADMSQQEMADLMGLHQNTIGMYETHKRYPTLDIILCFCLAAGCESSDILYPVYTDEDLEKDLKRLGKNKDRRFKGERHE